MMFRPKFFCRVWDLRRKYARTLRYLDLGCSEEQNSLEIFENMKTVFLAGKKYQFLSTILKPGKKNKNARRPNNRPVYLLQQLVRSPDQSRGTSWARFYSETRKKAIFQNFSENSPKSFGFVYEKCIPRQAVISEILAFFGKKLQFVSLSHFAVCLKRRTLCDILRITFGT